MASRTSTSSENDKWAVYKVILDLTGKGNISDEDAILLACSIAFKMLKVKVGKTVNFGWFKINQIMKGANDFDKVYAGLATPINRKNLDLGPLVIPTKLEAISEGLLALFPNVIFSQDTFTVGAGSTTVTFHDNLLSATITGAANLPTPSYGDALCTLDATGKPGLYIKDQKIWGPAPAPGLFRPTFLYGDTNTDATKRISDVIGRFAAAAGGSSSSSAAAAPLSGTGAGGGGSSAAAAPLSGTGVGNTSVPSSAAAPVPSLSATPAGGSSTAVSLLPDPSNTVFITDVDYKWYLYKLLLKLVNLVDERLATNENAIRLACALSFNILRQQPLPNFVEDQFNINRLMKGPYNAESIYAGLSIPINRGNVKLGPLVTPLNLTGVAAGLIGLYPDVTFIHSGITIGTGSTTVTFEDNFKYATITGRSQKLPNPLTDTYGYTAKDGLFIGSTKIWGPARWGSSVSGNTPAPTRVTAVITRYKTAIAAAAASAGGASTAPITPTLLVNATATAAGGASSAPITSIPATATAAAGSGASPPRTPAASASTSSSASAVASAAAAGAPAVVINMPKYLIDEEDVVNIQVPNDGWCLYKTVLAGFNMESTDIIARLLACSLGEWLLSKIPDEDDEEGADNLTEYIKEIISREALNVIGRPSGSTLKGIPIRVADAVGNIKAAKNDGTSVEPQAGTRLDYIPIDEEGNFVEQYIAGLSALCNSTDITAGPQIWPNVEFMNKMLIDLVKVKLFVYSGPENHLYTFQPSTSFEIADNNYILINFSDGNHYSYLYPRIRIVLPPTVPLQPTPKIFASDCRDSILESLYDKINGGTFSLDEFKWLIYLYKPATIKAYEKNGKTLGALIVEKSLITIQQAFTAKEYVEPLPMAGGSPTIPPEVITYRTYKDTPKFTLPVATVDTSKTAFMRACESGTIGEVIRLVTTEEKRATTTTGFNGLFYAMRARVPWADPSLKTNLDNVITVLLTKPGPEGICDEQNRDLALIHATMYNDFNNLNFILDKCGNEAPGYFLYEHALEYKHYGIAEYLYSHIDEADKPPLGTALVHIMSAFNQQRQLVAEFTSAHTVDVLLNNLETAANTVPTIGEVLNTGVLPTGGTPLLSRLSDITAEQLQRFIALGGNINQQSTSRNSALHVEAFTEKFSLVRRLFNSGADPFLINESWISALQAIARININNRELIDSMIGLGTYIEVPDSFVSWGTNRVILANRQAIYDVAPPSGNQVLVKLKRNTPRILDRVNPPVAPPPSAPASADPPVSSSSSSAPTLAGLRHASTSRSSWTPFLPPAPRLPVAPRPPAASGLFSLIFPAVRPTSPAGGPPAPLAPPAGRLPAPVGARPPVGGRPPAAPVGARPPAPIPPIVARAMVPNRLPGPPAAPLHGLALPVIDALLAEVGF